MRMRLWISKGEGRVKVKERRRPAACNGVAPAAYFGRGQGDGNGKQEGQEARLLHHEEASPGRSQVDLSCLILTFANSHSPPPTQPQHSQKQRGFTRVMVAAPFREALPT